mgnify:FL=1
MDILYDHKKTEECRHTFTINEGGEIDLRVSNGSACTVTIIFKDRKFHAVIWQMSGDWENTRSAWWVRGAIADKIKELENYYNAPTAG